MAGALLDVSVMVAVVVGTGVAVRIMSSYMSSSRFNMFSIMVGTTSASDVYNLLGCTGLQHFDWPCLDPSMRATVSGLDNCEVQQST